MRRKIVMVIMAMVISVSCYAQFEAGKKYIGASLSGLDLSYNGSKELSLGVQAKGGYLLQDNFMLLAQAAYEKQTDVPYTVNLGLGARYYLVQNGIYFGASASYTHSDHFDDVMPSVQVGYSFFINGSVTIEPELYYNQSFKNHGDYSTIGFRIGLGVYL